MGSDLKMMKNGCRLAVVLAALALGSTFAFPGAATGAPPAARDENKFKPGDTAPDFTLQDLSGKQFKLSDYKGKSVVLLNFWGVRCGACLEEMPHLDNIYKKYAGKGLVAFSVVSDGFDAQTVVETMKDTGTSVSYPILLDPEFSATDLYIQTSVPLTLVIDRKGIIQYIHLGFQKGRDEKTYEEYVAKALGG